MITKVVQSNNVKIELANHKTVSANSTMECRKVASEEDGGWKQDSGGRARTG
jgi:hypothetical protein